MKLIFAVIRDKDANKTVESMVERHIGVTKLASSGGFLRDGNTTLLIGVEQEQVDEVLALLKKNCARRSEVEFIAPHSTGGVPAWNLGHTPVTVEAGGATVFVVDVDRFEKL